MSRRELLLVVLLSLGVALVICSSLLPSLGSALLDGGPFAVSQFWIADSVWTQWLQGQWHSRMTAAVSHPFPMTMTFVGWPLIVLGFVFRLLLPSVLAFNLAFIILLSAGNFAAVLLFRRILGVCAPAMVAGVIFGSSPYVLIAIFNGHIYSMFVCWIPLAVFFAHRALSGGRPWDLLGVAVAIAVAVMDNPYHGGIALGWCLLLALFHVAGSWTRSRGLRAGLVALVVLVGAGGASSYYISELDPGDTSFVHLKVAMPGPWCGDALETALGIDQGSTRTVMASVYNQSVDPYRLVSAPGLPMQHPGDCLDRGPIHRYYVGISVLLLVLVSLIFRRSRALWKTAIGAGIFLLASMGPLLLWNGEVVCLQGLGFTLPYSGALEVFPFLKSMGGIYRWSVGATLGLAALAGVGLFEVMSRFRPGRRSLVAWAAGLLVLTDFMVIGTVPMPMDLISMERPPCSEWLREQPEEGGVLSLPWKRIKEKRGLAPNTSRPYLQQWHHGLPVAAPVQKMEWLSLCASASPEDRLKGAKLRSKTTRQITIKHLNELRIRWLVVRTPEPMSEDELAPFIEFFGAPRCACWAWDGEQQVFQVPLE